MLENTSKETQTEKNNVLTKKIVDKLSLNDILDMTVSDPNCPDKKFPLPEIICACATWRDIPSEVAKRILSIQYMKDGTEYTVSDIKTKEEIINKYYDLTKESRDIYISNTLGIPRVS